MTAELVQVAPAPALRDAVLRLTGYRERVAGPVRFTEMPCTFVPVIIDLGDGWSIGDARADVPMERVGPFVAGLTGFPVAVEHPGHAHCLQIDLRPRSARRLLGVPMHELANRTVALDDVLGAGARDLVARVGDTAGWSARFAVVQDAIAARLAAAPPLRREVGWALERVAAGGRPARVGDVARELGWSHRRLIAGFRDEVGLPPKLVARIARFERARAVIAAHPEADLAGVAARCGYADQAHLSREVRDLAGTTPAHLRAPAVNSVQDRAGATA